MSLRNLSAAAVALAAILSSVSLAAPTANGTFVYSNNTTTPQARRYTASSNTFAAQAATVTGAGQTFIVDRAAPTRNEHIAGYVTTTGQLYVIRWNGTTWTNEWNIAVGGAGVNGRRFDIGYEDLTGDAIVVYSNNAAGANELRYRIWNGATWTAATNLDSARLTGIPNAIKIATRPGTDQLAATIADMNNILTTLIWSGTAWGNEPTTAHATNLYRSVNPGDCDSFDTAYATASGDLFVAFHTQTPQQNHRQYTQAGGWQAVTSWATARTSYVMVATADPDPASNRIIFAFDRTASTTLYARVWNGTAMSAVGSVGTTNIAPALNRRPIAAGWLTSGATKVGVVTWMNNAAANNRMDYGYTANDGGAWTTNLTWTIPGTSPTAKQWMDLAQDPKGADTLLVTFSDAGSDVWAKRLVLSAGPTFTWSNADGGAALVTTLPNLTTLNFWFAYDRTSNALAAGTVTATGSGTSINVVAPFTGDLNANGAATVEYKESTSGTWINWTPVTRGSGQFTATITGLTCGTSYDVRVTYTDADGVSGTAQQPLTNILLDQCTLTGALSAVPSCTSLAVTGTFTQDVNANNSVTLEYRPTGQTWTTWTPVTRGAGQFTATITGLNQNAGYELRMTFTDADNVSGTNPLTATVTTANTCAIAGTLSITPGCSTMDVVATFTGDSDGDATGLLEYKRAVDATWSTWTPVTHGAGQLTATITGLLASTSYNVRFTYQDADGVSGTTTQTQTASTNCLKTAVGTVTATRATCATLNVTATYTNDTNANNTLLVEYRVAGGTWTTWQTLPHAASYSTTITGLSQSSDYEVRATYQDADGVTGTNPQTKGPFDRCSTLPGNISETHYCRSIDVTAPYTKDSDANNTCRFEYKRSIDATWTLWQNAVHAASPYATSITGLTPGTSYDARVTFIDTTGVDPVNPQILTVPLPACGGSLSLASPGQPVAANIAAGTPGAVVGRVRFTASAGTITLTQLRVANNAGTAVAGSDISGAQLYDDANNNGVIDAGESLLAVGRWDASVSRWMFSGLSYAVVSGTPRSVIVAINVAHGATTGRTFTMQVTQADVTVNPYNEVATGTVTGNLFTTAAGALEGNANITAPLAIINNPADGAVISGTFRFQVQVYNPGGLAALTSVQVSRNNGADAYGLYTFNLTTDRNANYNVGPDAAVYERQLTLAPGGYTLKVQVANAALQTSTSTPVVITVNAAGKGDGNLLVRDNSSELCLDCHALKTHSSQEVGTKYGSWGFSCRHCHTPHNTTNIYLIKKSITPPAIGSYRPAQQIAFSTKTGDSNQPGLTNRPAASFANSDYSGPCQVCHTRTQGQGGVARWRYNQNLDTHYTAAAGTQACTACHSHQGGFAGGESRGGAPCSGCHGTIWDGLNGGVAKTSKHAIGNVTGTNDNWQDSGLTWASPLSGNAASGRSCTNMCHPDHTHNAPPAGTTHDPNVHQDATNAASRTYGRDGSGNISSGTPDRTDFSGTAANGGMCLSCHRFDVDAARPAIGIAGYNASAHDYTNFSTYGAWTYELHDTSLFDRNCTKCHSDSANTAQAITGTDLGGPHYSGQPNLLTGTKTPNGAPATFVCYGCHGNGTTGTNRSGKDIATQIAHATTAGQAGHPANSDNVHASVTEYTNAAFGNTLGVTGRHSNCLDCHDPHEAQAGTHAAQTNTAGPPLQGAWGVSLSTLPAYWAAPTSASFTKKVIVAGTDPEAILCFKCHSSYYGTLPTTPSGTFTETDTAREFNPNNVGNFAGSWATGETAGSFHPVLASAGSNLGATSNIKAPWTRTSLMTCGDCHESETTTDPNGPHGSASKFILKGPNTTWSSTVATGSAGMPAGTFCINCHNANFTSSRFAEHYSRSNHQVACFNCHAAIPHGTMRPGLLAASGGVSTNVPALGLTDSAPYAQPPTGSTSKLYIVNYPVNNTTNWSQNNCGCNGSGH